VENMNKRSERLEIRNMKEQLAEVQNSQRVLKQDCQVEERLMNSS